MRAPLLSGECAVQRRSPQNGAFAVQPGVSLFVGLLFFVCVMVGPSTHLTNFWSMPEEETQGSDMTLVTQLGRGPAIRSAFHGLTSHFSAPPPRSPRSCPRSAGLSSSFPVLRSQLISRAAASTDEDDKIITAEFTEPSPEVGTKPDLEVASNSTEEVAERAELKRSLMKLCASYDRGFGATPRARQEVDGLIAKLEALNPTPMDANRGIGGGPHSAEEGPPPLQGIWRMVWTTALDVLTLGSSPVALPGAIYQVIEPPIATNIIDFIPRPQALLPTSFPATLVRAEVKTRTSFRVDDSNRVGVVFEAAKILPVEVLGTKPDFLPPLSFNFPQVNVQDLPGVNPDTAPAYFDVLYLDQDMLVIKQNAPGGYFVLINVPSCDP